MDHPKSPLVAQATAVAPQTTPSNYPEPLAARMRGRIRRPLGDFFELSHFGVNLTVLAPAEELAIRHAHCRQHEFIYVVSGHPVLVTDAGLAQRTPACVPASRPAQVMRTS